MKSLHRMMAVFSNEFRMNIRRPLIFIFILILFLLSLGLSQGQVTVRSGDATIGGTKAVVTSEFNVSLLLAMVVFLFYPFFNAVIAGMSVIWDQEISIGELLKSSKLKQTEYILGKFLSINALFVMALLLQVFFCIVFNHIIPNAEHADIRGPFHLMNYLKPALFFGVPLIVFITAISIFIGIKSQKPIMVYLAPVFILLCGTMFLWMWSPSWLPDIWNKILMILDISGFRWLNETYLKVDKGVQFYNNESVKYDWVFWTNRAFLMFMSLVAVVLSSAHKMKSKTKLSRNSKMVLAADRNNNVSTETAGLPQSVPQHDVGWLKGMFYVIRIEMSELKYQAGLYLFLPIIALQIVGSKSIATGYLGAENLMTSGHFAVNSLPDMTLLLCLLLMFYAVESMQRETKVGIEPIYQCLPIKTSSFVIGKVIAANSIAVGLLIPVFIFTVSVILFQGSIQLTLFPFAIVWFGLLIPTLFVWTTLIVALFSILKNRYSTYAVGLALMAITGLCQILGKMNWVGNWDFWKTVIWTDMGMMELDRTAIILNRLLVLSASVVFIVIAIKFYPRRRADAMAIVNQLNFLSICRKFAFPALLALIPITLGSVLFIQVREGFQGSVSVKKAKDYWRKNIATYLDYPLPAVTHVDVDLNLYPEEKRLESKGFFHLRNISDNAITQIPITGGFHWQNLQWTQDGVSVEPENRAGLYVLHLQPPLLQNQEIDIGFEFQSQCPAGISKNGGGVGEFVLPSGAVLTSFSTSFVPIMGYVESIGVDKDNDYESKVYTDDFYLNTTKPLFGSQIPFTSRIAVAAPSEYTVNSVGTLTERSITGNRTLSVWESDYPVRFFNVVAGKLVQSEGDGTSVYYYPGHAVNIPQMQLALDSARKYYSQWYCPFPWSELKVTEFPGYEYYAQGFPTNISFSENIGFLVKDDPHTQFAFLIVAHESAHQWWGNILTPGDGPGGNILSEGMAHFSTILLTGEVLGDASRKDFCKRIETAYGDDRQADSERPLVKVDGTRPGDDTVTYNKGGWAFWMMYNFLGKEPCLCGIQQFISLYRHGPDYPVLQDFTRTMELFTQDKLAYNRFIDQWFFRVVVPEYQFGDIQKRKVPEYPDTNPQWEASGYIKNIGSGVMSVVIAATAYDPNKLDDIPQEELETRQSRITVEVPENKEIPFVFACPFEPEFLVADPDVMILQLNRKQAMSRL